jgi:C4-dicarboxylate transporter, DctQ subunit
MKKWLFRIEEALLAVCIISTTFVLFVNIVLRYLFDANTTWAEELIRYVMIWITFIGSSVCFGRGLHVGIDFFLEFVSKKWNIVIGFFVNIVSMILMVFMLYYGMKLVQFGMNSGQITPSLRIEIFWVYLCIPLGAALSLIHLAINMFEQVRKLQTDAIEENEA